MADRHAYDLYSDAEWAAVQERSKPFSQQIKTIFKEDPGIPIFLGLTCFALGSGMKQSFVKRDPAKANSYMFMRVSAQAAAAGAVVWSIVKATNRDAAKQQEIQNKIALSKQKPIVPIIPTTSTAADL